MKNEKLRLNAEKILKANKQENINNIDTFSKDEIKRIVHNLQVHQIEIEMQNEELLETQEKLREVQARYFDIYNNAPVGYIILSENDMILELNTVAKTMFGYESNNYKQETLNTHIFDKSQDKYYLHKKALNDSRMVQECDIQFKKKDGTLFWGHLESMVVHEKSSIIYRIMLSDITARMEAKKRLIEEELKLKLVLNSTGSGIYSIDTNGICNYVNQSTLAILGYDTDDELLGKSIHSTLHHSHEDGTVYSNKDCILLASMKRNEEVAIDDIIWKKDGSFLQVAYTSYPMFHDKENIGSVVSFTDISHRIRKLKEIEHLSFHDSLTSLHNRRFFYEQLVKMDNPDNYPIGIMMFDINGLKIINDAFGHFVGDDAIKIVAKILLEIVGNLGILSRIGGDEFAAIIPHTNKSKLEQYKYSIVNEMKEMKIKNIEMSLAIGYGLKSKININIEEVIQTSENLMYRHKIAEGKGVRTKAIAAILHTLTDKYALEKEHSIRVSQLCKSLAKHLNLMRTDEIKELEMAGLFHDIGKISIPDNILNKPGSLSKDEYDIIKTHTEVGYQILRAADEYSELAIHALHHHEHWDGNGYPLGLKGESIPLFSRIICIADSFEAMTSDRPYRKKMSIAESIIEIRRCAGTQFDPSITEIFIKKVITNNDTIQKI